MIRFNRQGSRSNFEKIGPRVQQVQEGKAKFMVPFKFNPLMLPFPPKDGPSWFLKKPFLDPTKLDNFHPVSHLCGSFSLTIQTLVWDGSSINHAFRWPLTWVMHPLFSYLSSWKISTLLPMVSSLIQADTMDNRMEDWGWAAQCCADLLPSFGDE